MSQESIYNLIGPKAIHRCLQLFYDAAFADVFIGYFFWNKDKNELIERQFAFTSALLGGPSEYRGPSLESLHKPLKIRKAHFMRRQILLKEAMIRAGISEHLAQGWLEKEKKLISRIVFPKST